MKGIFFVLLSAFVSVNVNAQEFRSSFGFPFELSKDWLVVTPKDASAQFEAETLKSLHMEAGDQDNAEAILERVKAGNVEFYFDKKYSKKNFTNNISAQLLPGVQIQTIDNVKATCTSLPKELQLLHGDVVLIKKCALSKSNGIQYIAYEYSLSRMDVAIVQREIPYLSNTTLILVGGSNSDGLRALMSAEDNIAASITKFVSEKKKAKLEDIGASIMIGQQKQIELVKESMHNFAISVNAKEFSTFYKYISHLWQQQTSAVQLDEAFKAFTDNNVNLLPLDNVAPLFDTTPSIGEDSFLSLKGYYPTKPSKVTFEFGYVYEGSNWKLAQTKININPIQ